jgi:hypothetical protein
MNRALVIVATLSLAFPLTGMAQSTIQTASLNPQISAQEVSALIKSANSPAEYKQLAAYYRQQETKFRAEAATDKAERDRRAQVNAGLYQKYPRPVDSAQYFYQKDVANADDAALQAQHFEQLAGVRAQNDQQLATAPQGK